MATASTLTRDRLLARVRRQGWLTRRDLDAEHIHARWLRRLLDEGVIERVSRGVYRPSGAPETTDETLFDACAAVPRGVVCLASALAYHRLSTVNPTRIDIAVQRDERRPVVSYPPLAFHKFRDMTTGLQRVRGRQGRELRVFDAERTICDAFRLRREVGKDVALEALQTYLRRRPRPNINTLLATARKTGAYRTMRPYVEALV